MLRDCVACGIDSTAIQTRLLKQLELTLEDAIQTAMAMETAKRDTGEICQASSSSSAFATHRVTTPMGQSPATAVETGILHLSASM